MNWEDIFYILEENGRWFAVFKHNDVKLSVFSGSEWKVQAESVAFNWVNQKANEKLILDIIAELTILGDNE